MISRDTRQQFVVQLETQVSNSSNIDSLANTGWARDGIEATNRGICCHQGLDTSKGRPQATMSAATQARKVHLGGQEGAFYSQEGSPLQNLKIHGSVLQHRNLKAHKPITQPGISR